MRKTIIAALAAVLVAGCASTGEQNGRLWGGLGGAAGGALIGDALDCQGCALIGGIVGALAGGYAGGEIGRRMDEHDANQVHRAVHTNRTGQTSTWVNPDSNVQYDVTPVKTFNTANGPCREVIVGEKVVGEARQEVYTTACYDGNGGWKVQ